MTSHLSVRFLLSIVVVLLLAACQSLDVQSSPPIAGKESQTPARSHEARVVKLGAPGGLPDILPQLGRKRVVYVGETHDRYGHHLNQLAVIRALHARNPALSIGLEFFQQPYQQPLDDYIAGRIDEREMLAASEWYERWQYDYRLYRPILRYAREQKIPLVALNVPRELTKRVSEVGLAGLDAEERARLPRDYDTSDTAYKRRLQQVFQQHANSKQRDFERFMEVQLTWDEGMAQQVANYLQAHPDRNMVVLAGAGHLMYGSGIPQRVTRRLGVSSAILLPADDLRVRPGIADYLVYPEVAELPQAGLMGVMLASDEQGVAVAGVVPDSAADRAGIEKGDVIQTLDEQTMHRIADVKIAMLDKSPGDRVRLRLLRQRMVLGDRLLDLEFDLGGAH